MVDNLGGEACLLIPLWKSGDGLGGPESVIVEVGRSIYVNEYSQLALTGSGTMLFVLLGLRV